MYKIKVIVDSIKAVVYEFKAVVDCIISVVESINAVPVVDSIKAVFIN